MRRKIEFLTVKGQFINAEGKIKLKNHHLATVKAIINLSKKHQWILKLMGENLMKMIYLHSLKVAFNKITTNYKEKKVNL